MSYDVDYEYPFKRDEHDMPYLPENMKEDGELYVLPNGKYLPTGCYLRSDGSCLIYEPSELSPYAEMLASFN